MTQSAYVALILNFEMNLEKKKQDFIDKNKTIKHKHQQQQNKTFVNVKLGFEY